MPEHRVGIEAQPGQHLVQGPLRVEDDVDRRRGGPELFVTAGHRAEQVLAGRHGLAEVAGDPVGRVEQAAHFGKMEAEIGEHAGILRAFTREEESQAARGRRSRAARPSNRRPGRRESTGKRGRPGGAARR